MFINKIFDRLSINYISKYLVFSHLIIYTLTILTNQQQLLTTLQLHANSVLKGELWRLFTFMVIPAYASPLSFIISLFIMWWAGTQLEELWGKVRFNQLLFILWLATICIAFLTPNQIISNATIFSIIFTIFCFSFPDLLLYLFFVIPCKLKIIGWINILSIAITIFKTYGIAKLTFILPSLIGYIFYRTFNNNRYFSRQFKNMLNHTQNAKSFHLCNTCKRTENSDSKLQFRICSKCNEEFCVDHITKHHCQTPEK